MNRAQKWGILSSAFAYRPEEMIADSCCLVNPHTPEASGNHNPHLSKMRKKRKAAAKAAKQARKRNRTKR